MSHPSLILSSFLFSSVALHAYISKSPAYLCIYIWVSTLSLIFHATGELGVFDKITAHLAFIFTLIDTHVYWPKNKQTIIYLGLVAGFWLLQTPFPEHSVQLHVALHITAIIGMHIHLTAKT
jgi:hypothetical protein